MLRPPAGWLLAVRVAWCAVRTDRAMDRPSPMPSLAPARDAVMLKTTSAYGLRAERSSASVATLSAPVNREYVAQHTVDFTAGWGRCFRVRRLDGSQGNASPECSDSIGKPAAIGSEGGRCHNDVVERYVIGAAGRGLAQLEPADRSGAEILSGQGQARHGHAVDPDVKAAGRPVDPGV